MGLFRRNKNNDKPVIKQIIDLVPRHILRAEIDQHKSDKGCHKYKTYDLFVAKTFGQLNNCKSNLIDNSAVTLCLSMFDWAKYRTAKAGIKLHTCIDEETLLPEIVNITEAAVHDRKELKDLIF